MARDRFTEIMKYLRCYIKAIHRPCLNTDKFVLSSEIWNPFIQNCISCFQPGPNLIVHEKLFPFKCRCPFLQFIASKPDKFGIKFWLADDVDTKYVCNGFPYTCKEGTRPANDSVAENVVFCLLIHFIGKGLNVTEDNFKCSKPLSDKSGQQSKSEVQSW